MPALIGVEAARQRWLLARVHERVSAIGQDRRRTSHPELPGIILCHYDMPRHSDIGPGREQRDQPTVNDCRARAVRYMQNLKSHRSSQGATPAGQPRTYGGGKADRSSDSQFVRA
jgi:hypothetical protein